MQSNLYQFQSRQIALIARVTPYAMAGHIANTTVIAIALAGSVRPAPLIIWCAYSYATALLLLYRHVRNRRRWPRSFHRAAKKATIYAFLLALPWSSLGVLYLGSLSHGEELLLAALGIGMAACGTVLLSAIPSAAFGYVSVILLPSALKYLLVGQEGYLLLGTLALSYWGCLAALIAKTSRDIRERQESELALAERNAQMALAGRAALVGSYAYDVNKGTMQVSEGYAAIHGLPEGTTETTLSEWRARVHPEDVGRVEGLRAQAFADRREEDNAEYRIVLPTGEVRWIERRGSISYSENGRPERVVGVNIDVTERKRAEERQRMLVRELDHRVKNVLASVATVAQRTREGSGSMDEFLQMFDGRIQSMANAHALLSRSNWRGCEPRRPRSQRAGALRGRRQCKRGRPRGAAVSGSHPADRDRAARTGHQCLEIWCADDAAGPHLRALGLATGRPCAGAAVAGVGRDWRPPRRHLRANPATAPAPSATSFPMSSAARSILPSMPRACAAE